MNSASTRCRACGSAEVAFYKNIRSHPLFTCSQCGLVFIDTINYSPKEFYDESFFVKNGPSGYNDYVGIETSFRKTFRKRLRAIERYCPFRVKRILDFGCGPGFFINEARQRGYDAVGVDISDYAVRFARDKFSETVFSDLPQVNKTFDLITLWDVVEHLVDPVVVLSQLNNLLVSDGRIIMTTGDVSSLLARVSGKKWHIYNMPEHISYFSPRSIEVLLRRTGFTVEAIRYEYSYCAFSYLIERISKSVFGSHNNAFIRGSRKISASFPGNLFDIMTVYARKAE